MQQFLIGVLATAVVLTGGYYFFHNTISSEPAMHDESMHAHEDGTMHEDHELEVVYSDDAPIVSLYTGAYGSAHISTDGSYRYITSDGLPEHETGKFPNPGNPNTISEQNHDYRVSMSPQYQSTVTDAPIPGVALNGIPLEPGTAERYQNTDWAIEAFDANGMGGLGIDWSNAHVQPDGTYHYHAVPSGLLKDALSDQSDDLIQLAWASDGFPILYSQSNAYHSSWRVKSGTRPSGPGGVYDGTYTQDFEYVTGLGELDECNGTFIGEQYVYFFTDSFPYIQRCVHGLPDDSFDRFGGGAGPAGQNGGPRSGPPQAAVDACSGKSNGASCSIGTNTGTCRTTPENMFACVP
ncbi:YHYH protein [Candidatus Nomurabacteria bacterium]|nr:YHYH protein [Candidatus Nomurabacteria bacterium]